LREVLVGPMRFTPQGRSYQFEGEASLGRLLAGVIGDATNLVPVRGFERISYRIRGRAPSKAA